MLSIIIIDYKSMKQTISYLENFAYNCSDLNDIHFIIIDNSTDENNFNELSASFEQVQDYITCANEDFGKYMEKVKLYKFNNIPLVAVKSTCNLGYAKGNNIGTLISNKIFNDRYILFSNNDLSFKSTFRINSLLSYFEMDKKIAVIGPKIVDTHGKPQSPRKQISIWRMLILGYLNMLTPKLLNKHINDIDYTNENKYTYWVPGCFIVVDGEAFNKAGMFDEKTFLFAEEMILSERLLKNDKHVFFVNDFELIHFHGQTVKKAYDVVKSCEISFNSVYYYYKIYMKSKKTALLISKVCFFIFKLLFPLKCRLKRH